MYVYSINVEQFPFRKDTSAVKMLLSSRTTSRRALLDLSQPHHHHVRTYILKYRMHICKFQYTFTTIALAHLLYKHISSVKGIILSWFSAISVRCLLITRVHLFVKANNIHKFARRVLIMTIAGQEVQQLLDGAATTSGKRNSYSREEKLRV